MTYEKEIHNINESLKMFAKVIIDDSGKKDSFTQEVLNVCIDFFLDDVIQFGLIKAENYLIQRLNDEYRRGK